MFFLGKNCKTGRVNNNPIVNTTNNVSAPLTNNTNSNQNPSNNQAPVILTPTSIPTIDTSLTNISHEVRPIPTHPTSAHQSSTLLRNPYAAPSLKLRREMTQPALNRVELTSSECPIDKMVDDDLIPFPYRSSLKINASTPPFDFRSKRSKANANRLTVDYFPTKTVSRSKANENLPSPKGKHLSLYQMIWRFLSTQSNRSLIQRKQKIYR